MTDIGRILFLLALSAAKNGDLTTASLFAARSAQLLDEPKDALRLWVICQYELGGSVSSSLIYFENDHEFLDGLGDSIKLTDAGLDAVRAHIARGKWRLALKAAESIPHQSVRVLNIRGLILASAGRYAAAAKLFSAAFEKDRGGHAAPMYLKESVGKMNAIWKWVF
jgi:tetratricopeptide (TPR) repeat protein